MGEACMRDGGSVNARRWHGVLLPTRRACRPIADAKLVVVKLGTGILTVPEPARFTAY